MEMQQIIEQAERNIRQALQDYRRYTTQTEVLDDVSDTFIRNLARDSSLAKQGLRELFSRSPVWDEKLDALVINGTRTHDPDYYRVRSLAIEILYPAIERAETDKDKYYQIYKAVDFFSYPYNGCLQEAGIQAISELAPKAYGPGKKRSRVFKALCVSLGVADETAGSEFQKLYAQFADELSAKQIGFKLYVSINPAHFLTMSNPKADSRGCTLTSCHSFNSTDYRYNNGCSGYARDQVSFIAFTVDDPDNPELLNNRKITRQVFAYKPGNGLLLQSRMYNTSGGTQGAQGDSRLYRDLVQREISMLEGAPNLWKTYPYCGGHEGCVETDEDFGGYTDWAHAKFDGKVSIRADHGHGYRPLRVGAAGLCVCCGKETSEYLYCGGEEGICEEGMCRCGSCGELCDERTEAYGRDGGSCLVCEDCLGRFYTRCEECGCYCHNDCIRELGSGEYVCTGCMEGGSYACCRECGDYYRDEDIYPVVNEDGESVYVCRKCHEGYEECPECREYVKIRPLFGGTMCPACEAVFEGRVPA